MSDLVEWLTAQLDEDERYGQSILGVRPASVFDGERWVPVLVDGHYVLRQVAAHRAILRWVPVLVDGHYVLRQVAAHRAILARHRPATPEDVENLAGVVDNIGVCMGCAPGHQGGLDWPCPNVLDLASIYADQPDYDPTWTPQR